MACIKSTSNCKHAERFTVHNKIYVALASDTLVVHTSLQYTNKILTYSLSLVIIKDKTTRAGPPLYTQHIGTQLCLSHEQGSWITQHASRFHQWKPNWKKHDENIKMHTQK